MLKAQLREFIDESDDVRLKKVMTFPPESASGKFYVTAAYYWQFFHDNIRLSTPKHVAS